ncbi:MAG: PEP-CTERM sorting domain-containing protein [Pseudomonadota bacterium]
MKRSLAVVTAALFVVFGLSSPAQASILYNDFTDLSNIQQNGVTAVIGDPVFYNGQNVLRLTSSAFLGDARSGSAFCKAPVALGSDNALTTHFEFQISNPQGATDADAVQGGQGFTFTIATAPTVLGGAGAGIGYSGINNSVTVEFDTWGGPWVGLGSQIWDPVVQPSFRGPNGIRSGNHVGINLNGNVTSEVWAHVGPSPVTDLASAMNNGNVWDAWVDYNGAIETMEVRLANNGIRPQDALLSYAVDLSAILGQDDAYLGFTSGTQGNPLNDRAHHDIRSWEADVYPVPEPATLLLIGSGFAGLGASWRRRNG